MRTPVSWSSEACSTMSSSLCATRLNTTTVAWRSRAISITGCTGSASGSDARAVASNEATEQVVEAAVLEQREREQVVGRGDEMRGRDRQLVHLRDDAREDRVERAAQLHRHPRAQLLQAVG